jgi:gas vesicle structural protein
VRTVGPRGCAAARRVLTKEEPDVSTQDGYLQRSPHPSSLYDVLNLILDKGLVIDLYVRASLIGIEVLTIDARVVIASVDTYLRFAEAVNRLDLEDSARPGLPELLSSGAEKAYEAGAKKVTKGAIESATEKVAATIEDAKETVEEILHPGDKDRSS